MHTRECPKGNDTFLRIRLSKQKMAERREFSSFGTEKEIFVLSGVVTGIRDSFIFINIRAAKITGKRNVLM